MKSINWLLILIILIILFSDCSDAGWKFVSPMPKGRYGHDATLGLDGKIYVMGGYVWYTHDGMYSNLVYDRNKDKWEFLEPVPGWLNSGVYKIYDNEKGFWRSVRPVKDRENYYEGFFPEDQKDPWKLLPDPIPLEKLRKTGVERQGDGVAIVTGKDGIIYWIGGNGKWGDYGEDIVLTYNPAKKEWPDAEAKRMYSPSGSYRIKTLFKTDMPSMNDRRIDHEAVITSDGKIYVMGGYHKERNEDNYGNVTGNKIFVLKTMECYDPELNKWEYKKPLMRERMLFAAVVGPDDKIYVFGGAAGLSTRPSTQILNTVEVYDPKTDSWSYSNPMPFPRSDHAAVTGADGNIYLLGGAESKDGPPLDTVLIYNPIEDKWKEGPKMNLPRAVLAAVATPDGKIYAIGGTDVGAYETKKKLNLFLPKKHELYTGKVQDTVEVLDIFE